MGLSDMQVSAAVGNELEVNVVMAQKQHNEQSVVLVLKRDGSLYIVL